MRTVRRLAWAAVAAAATASPATAQMGGGGGNTGGANTGGNLGNFQTNAPAATTTLNTAGTSTTGSTGSTGSTGNTADFPQLVQVEKAPQINAPSTFTNGGKVAASNFLGPTYIELRSLGLLDKSRSAAAPAGLGNTVFSTTGAAGARGTTTATGRTGGTATGQTTDPGGQLVQLPRQIAYTAQLKFAAPPMPAPRLQADLRGVIDRAGLAASPAGVQVLVDGNAVVLRGAVADGDEARLVEGLVRLTPGVGRITNELTYARP